MFYFKKGNKGRKDLLGQTRAPSNCNRNGLLEKKMLSYRNEKIKGEGIQKIKKTIDNSASACKKIQWKQMDCEVIFQYPTGSRKQGRRS